MNNNYDMPLARFLTEIPFLLGVYLQTLKSNAKKVFLRIAWCFCLGVSADFF